MICHKKITNLAGKFAFPDLLSHFIGFLGEIYILLNFENYMQQYLVQQKGTYFNQGNASSPLLCAVKPAFFSHAFFFQPPDGRQHVHELNIDVSVMLLQEVTTNSNSFYFILLKLV